MQLYQIQSTEHWLQADAKKVLGEEANVFFTWKEYELWPED